MWSKRLDKKHPTNTKSNAREHRSGTSKMASGTPPTASNSQMAEKLVEKYKLQTPGMEIFCLWVRRRRQHSLHTALPLVSDVNKVTQTLSRRFMNFVSRPGPCSSSWWIGAIGEKNNFVTNCFNGFLEYNLSLTYIIRAISGGSLLFALAMLKYYIKICWPHCFLFVCFF